MSGGVSRSKLGRLNVGLVIAAAALAVSVQAVSALAVVGATDAKDLRDLRQELSHQTVAAGSCVMVYPFDLPGCLPWQCHCVQIPSCTC